MTRIGHFRGQPPEGTERCFFCLKYKPCKHREVDRVEIPGKLAVRIVMPLVYCEECDTTLPEAQQKSMIADQFLVEAMNDWKGPKRFIRDEATYKLILRIAREINLYDRLQKVIDEKE